MSSPAGQGPDPAGVRTARQAGSRTGREPAAPGTVLAPLLRFMSDQSTDCRARVPRSSPAEWTIRARATHRAGSGDRHLAGPEGSASDPTAPGPRRTFAGGAPGTGGYFRTPGPYLSHPRCHTGGHEEHLARDLGPDPTAPDIVSMGRSRAGPVAGWPVAVARGNRCGSSGRARMGLTVCARGDPGEDARPAACPAPDHGHPAASMAEPQPVAEPTFPGLNAAEQAAPPPRAQTATKPAAPACTDVARVGRNAGPHAASRFAGSTRSRTQSRRSRTSMPGPSEDWKNVAGRAFLWLRMDDHRSGEVAEWLKAHAWRA